MDQQIRQMFLSQTTLWGALPTKKLAALARAMKLVELKNGETLIRQGEEGKSLFLVVEGRLEARLATAGTPRRYTVLGQLRRGELVGEMSVLSDQPRMCSVVAVRESKVLELARLDFLSIVAQHPEVLFGLTDELIRRRAEGQPSAYDVSSVALIPKSAKVDISRFVQSLRANLMGFGAVGVMRQQDAGRPRGDSFGEVFARFEQAHNWILYQGTPEASEWSRSVIRQADLILVVADDEDDPSLSELEQTALFGEQPASSAPVELVIVHASGERPPAGTARWLAERKVKVHHHVALSEPADFARLSRIISGRAHHLVLSGGGVRGFAHIGVLRALHEEGIPVDFVGGTSVGSGIAAFCAMRYSADRIAATLRPLLADATDVTLPLLSLSSGKRATRALQTMFGEPRIEDLWLNYFAVSADLERAEEFVHRRGPVWQAVRASTSLPGVYPPVPAEGRYLVDGGVLNNLPVDVMAGIRPGKLIAVDVSQESALEFRNPLPIAVSGWRLLWRRLNPFRRGSPDPSIADVLMRAGEMACVAMSRINKASTPVSLTIKPPVGGYRMLEFSAFDAIIEAGYRHALTEIQRWKTQAEEPRRSGMITLHDHKSGMYTPLF